MTMNDLMRFSAEPFAPLIGLASLMQCAFDKQDLRPVGAVLLERAQSNPQDANALLDLSTVLQLTGQRAAALAVQAEAIRVRSLYSLPAHGTPGLRLLVIMGPGDLMSNTPIEFLVEGADVALDLLYLTLDSEWPETVPDHDVLMVAIAESDSNQPLLQLVAQLLDGWTRPVLNSPQRIAVLSRDGVCAALDGTPGIVLPQTTRVDRSAMLALAADAAALAALAPDAAFPMIVRPVGSHAGQNLTKLSARDDIASYLDAVAGDRFYLARFIDYRSADGLFRKYRIAVIGGRPYVCHFAISSHWMIHYLNAGMDESPEKRRQEAECMATFDQQFAARHAAALHAINERMGLPYLGIDCAETADGQLLIFEIDNAMVVHSMESEQVYAYKKPAMRKVFDAFRRLLDDIRPGPNSDRVRPD
ncbi:MAG: RimK family alpha-L-glutamate ligase [Massilia sp.]|jgi:glutathione synthase/RimK-type ligase-like ATP-grasp enzyme|nr:RimK family alpha-L-glutamate ligase [Massilia sp.]